MVIGKVERDAIRKLKKMSDKFDAEFVREALVADKRAINELRRAWKFLNDESSKLLRAEDRLISLAHVKNIDMNRLENLAQPVLNELRGINNAIEKIKERILVEQRALA